MAQAKTTMYAVGDRVTVRSGKAHDAMTRDKTGTIRQIGTPALGIEFDGMSMGVHKWYTDDEVQYAWIATTVKKGHA